jgi:ubiquinone/menaquinone biosynthesis C-methylase UbiE
MRDWAISLLRCLECRGTRLQSRPAEVVCETCGRSYPENDDVADFLFRPHAAVLRERDAVHQLDREGQTVDDHARDVLRRLDAGAITAPDLTDSRYLRTIVESRQQLVELLRGEPLAAGSTALEIGADTCWASSVLLAAGCRVIATDITDHLFLAAAGASPNLCRLQADMNALPLGDDSVDVVFAASCLHHSWDLSRTFREIARVLKPGGTGYFCGEPMPSLARFVVGGGFGRKERALGINETWIRRRNWLRWSRQAGLEPRIVFPRLTTEQLQTRLLSRHVPRFIARLVRPFLPVLQVSAHLRVDKVVLTDTERRELSTLRKSGRLAPAALK